MNKSPHVHVSPRWVSRSLNSPLCNAIATAVTQWTAGVAYLTLWQGATYQAATIELPPWNTQSQSRQASTMWTHSSHRNTAQTHGVSSTTTQRGFSDHNVSTGCTATCTNNAKLATNHRKVSKTPRTLEQWGSQSIQVLTAMHLLATQMPATLHSTSSHVLVQPSRPHTHASH
jgi:hypothetical protein